MATRRERQKRKKVSARERAETHKSGFDSTSIVLPDGAKLFKLDSDKSRRIDIIPFKAGEGNPHAAEGELYFERTFWTHRGIGPNDDSFVCLAKTCKERCPVCELRAEMAKDPDSDEKEIKDLAPRERQLFNVIDVDNREAGIQLWDISYHLFGKFLDKAVKEADEDEDYEYFADPEEGYTLKLIINEKTMGKGSKPFYEAGQITFKNRAEQYGEEIVDEAYCLDELVKVTPYDKLKKILLQVDEPEDDEDEDEPASKKGKAKASSKKKSVEDEDDEDEPAPKKKPKAKPEEGDANEDEFEPHDVAIHSEWGRVEIVKVNSATGSAIVIDEDGDKVKAQLSDLSKPKPKASPKKKPVDDEDEDEPAPKKRKTKPVDDDEDDEDDEDEPAPKKASPKKKPKPPVDDEDEDEPAPKKRKAKPKDDDDDWGDWD